MKKGALLFALMVFFVGMGFAKTPETRALNKLSTRVVNPPRPHAKFKWLLVVEHTLYPRHIHYLYANKYHIFQEPDGWLWLLPEGRYEIFWADQRGTPRLDTVVPTVFHSILLSYPTILRHTIFLKSKAPKPNAVNNTNPLPFNDSRKIMKFWTTRAKKIKVNPKKAKIVFRE